MADNPYAQYATPAANPYAQYASGSTPAVPVAATTTPDDPSVLDQLGRSVALTGRGLAHGSTSLLGVVNDPIVAGVNAAESGLGVDPKYRLGNTSQATDMALNAAGVPQVTPQNGSERLASGLAQGLGGVATGVGVGSALANASSPAVSAAGSALASNPGSQIAAATTGTAAQNIAEANGASPGVQAAAGALGGMVPTGISAAGTGLANVATKAGAAILKNTVSPEAQLLAQKANDLGIDLNTPQIAKSTPVKVVNSVTAEAPFSGHTAVADNQISQFNQALAKTVGSPNENLSQSNFNEAKTVLSNGFNKIWSTNSLTLSPQDIHSAVTAANEAAANGETERAGRIANNVIEKLVSAQNANGGVIPGSVFQGQDSLLGQHRASGGIDGHYLGELQDSLRQSMQNQMSPAAAAELQDLRGKYRNILDLTPLVAKYPLGDIPPSMLKSAVTSSGAGKNAVAMGTRGYIGDLASIGQAFFKQPANSQTAQRAAYIGALKAVGTGGAAVASLPGTVASLGTARAIQSGLNSRGLYNALANIQPNALAPQAPINSNALSAYLGTIPVQQNALSKP